MSPKELEQVSCDREAVLTEIAKAQRCLRAALDIASTLKGWNYQFSEIDRSSDSLKNLWSNCSNAEFPTGSALIEFL